MATRRYHSVHRVQHFLLTVNPSRVGSMEPNMIYLASPYTHKIAGTRERRYSEALRITAFLMKKGHIIYSPIVHCHEISQAYGLPTDWDFWQKFCLGMLDKADEFWLLTLKGWEESKGCLAEYQHAAIRGIPYKKITVRGEIIAW